MSSKNVAVRVRDVSKHYLMFDRPEDRLKQMVVPRLERLARRAPSRYYRDFAALTNVSFDIRRAETVGIIGRNGSGKSTLLQIVCGTLQPTHGTVEINGRIAALLELGAGFNPEFTGRENVYLNAAILGLSRDEINARFDDIARFADIGEFIDQPVKTYSSGMYVRLAFATATNVDPDILVVDEALAVGDEAFQRKCFARIEDIKDKGGTILFVSHSAQTIVQLCDRAMLFDAGELILEGRPKPVVNQYQRLANATAEAARDIRAAIIAIHKEGPVEGQPATGGTEKKNVVNSPAVETAHPAAVPATAVQRNDFFDPSFKSKSSVSYASNGAILRNFVLLTAAGTPVNMLELGHDYIYQYDVEFTKYCEQVGFGMLIRSITGIELAGATTSIARHWRLPNVRAGEIKCVRFRFVCRLMPGAYFMNAGVTGEVGGTINYLHRVLDALAFRVAPQQDLTATGMIDLLIEPDVSDVVHCEPPAPSGPIAMFG